MKVVFKRVFGYIMVLSMILSITAFASDTNEAKKESFKELKKVEKSKELSVFAAPSNSDKVTVEYEDANGDVSLLKGVLFRVHIETRPATDPITYQHFDSVITENDGVAICGRVDSPSLMYQVVLPAEYNNLVDYGVQGNPSFEDIIVSAKQYNDWSLDENDPNNWTDCTISNVEKINYNNYPVFALQFKLNDAPPFGGKVEFKLRFKEKSAPQDVNLTINKKWLDASGVETSSTTPVRVALFNKDDLDSLASGDWDSIQSFILEPSNNYTTTLALPVGEYVIKEIPVFSYDVSYDDGNGDVPADSSVYEGGYAFALDADKEITIKNTYSETQNNFFIAGDDTYSVWIDAVADDSAFAEGQEDINYDNAYGYYYAPGFQGDETIAIRVKDKYTYVAGLKAMYFESNSQGSGYKVTNTDDWWVYPVKSGDAEPPVDANGKHWYEVGYIKDSTWVKASSIDESSDMYSFTHLTEHWTDSWPENNHDDWIYSANWNQRKGLSTPNPDFDKTVYFRKEPVAVVQTSTQGGGDIEPSTETPDEVPDEEVPVAAETSESIVSTEKPVEQSSTESTTAQTTTLENTENIPDGSIPEETLPKTGGIPMMAYSALATTFIGMGIITNKKRKK